MKRLVTHLLPAAAILPALLLGSYDRATAQEVTDNRQREDGWIRVPHVITAESKPYLEEKLGRALETPESHHIRAIHYGLEFETLGEMARYPLQKVAPILREADIAFANLETPLSDKARHSGAFRTPPAFADGLKWAGIDVVSTANNHALDAEGEGLLDTKAALWEAGVGAVGTGRNRAAEPGGGRTARPVHRKGGHPTGARRGGLRGSLFPLGH
jgi:hypothetical protein